MTAQTDNARMIHFLMDPIFAGLLFKINAMETTHDLESIQAEIDEAALTAFGEDGADFLSEYMEERKRLIRIGEANPRDGVNNILHVGLERLTPQVEELRDITRNAIVGVADLTAAYDLTETTPPTGEKQ